MRETRWGDVCVICLIRSLMYSLLFEAVFVCVCVCLCVGKWVAEECEARLVSPSRKDLIWTWLLSFIG